jgi:UDP-N-acetyl-2-amino-2-deoxyglucuronate dehydrogenase
MSVRFAIIGCGRIGKRHADQVIKTGKLVAVCDVNVEKCNEFATTYKATPYYDLQHLLENEPDLSVVSICTPNGLHATHSIMALKAGSNVLCEKPLCISSLDGLEMIKTAQIENKKLFVVKQNRYNPPIVFLKKLINENKLGEVYSFQINCFWNRPAQYYTDWKGTKNLDGGTLYTQFSHFIDLLYWLLGDVKTVNSTIKNFAHPGIEIEDTGTVTFEMQKGAIGTLHYTVNSFAQNMEGSFTVFGENGTVKVGGQYLNELEYCNVKDVEVPILPKGNRANGYGFYQGSMSNHDKVYENMVKALEDLSHDFASGEEGLKTVEIIEKIYLNK